MANFRSNRFGSVYIQPTPNQVGLKDIFTQPGHSLQPGAAVYFETNGSLQPAIASSLSKSSVIGLVESVNGDAVTVVYQGEIEFAAGTTSSLVNFPLLTGNTYYLSASITGGITAGYSTDLSTIIKPLMIPSDGYKGVVINSLPLSSTPFITLFTPVGSLVPYVGAGSNLPGGWLLCVGDALTKTSSNPPYADLYDIIGEKYGVYGITKTSTTGLTAFTQFDGSVDSPPTEGPGSTKNHYIEPNDIFKMVWGSNQSVVQAYSATGTTNNVTFKFLSAITGSTSFNSLGVGTEFVLKSLVTGEAAGYTSGKFFIPDLRGRMAVGAGTGRGLSTRTLGDFGGEESHVLSLSEIPSHSHTIPILNSLGISGSASYMLNGSTGGTLQATLSSYPQPVLPVTSVTGGANAHENMSPFMATNWLIRYRNNTGMAGIETGPRGAQGTTGSTGARGTTGATGIRGATGYALGALHYSYSSVTNPSPGYFTRYTTTKTNPDGSLLFTNNMVLSSEEYYGTGVGDYISASMSNTNSQRNCLAIVRSLKNPSNYARVYSLQSPYTVVNVTGPSVIPTTGTDTQEPQALFVAGNTLTYYRLPINQILATQGTEVEGEMYSVILIPSANDGVKGATGATGAKGATGTNGVSIGALTYYYGGDFAIDRTSNNGFFEAWNAYWMFSSKDYYGVDASGILSTIGSEAVTLDDAGEQVSKQAKAVQMTVRSVSDNSYIGQFYFDGTYSAVGLGSGVTSYAMTSPFGQGSIPEGQAGGLVSGQLYSIHLTPLPIDPSGFVEKTSIKTVYITADGGEVPELYIDTDGAVVADQGSTVNKTQPYGVSTNSDAPTSSAYLFSSMQGTYTKKEPQETEPVYPLATIKSNFIYSMQLTSQPCGGNCEGASGYIDLCSVVRDVNMSNYFTPPTETNIGLVKNGANTVFQSDVSHVVDGCSVNVFGYTGSYFTKIPVGISANYLNDSLGNTGRNTLAIDVYMNVNNIVVGNYIGIRPEYFTLALTGSATGHQSLSGVYKVSSVTGDSVRVYTPIPFGASGSNIFTGYITGGISGDFNQVDVYTVSMNFRDCSGYIVNSGDLTLGLSSHGLPFVVSFEGSDASSQAAKAVMAVKSGHVVVGEDMAFYGWPAYGAALFADSGGTINAYSPKISQNAVGVHARDNATIKLTNPVISSNTFGLYSRNGGSIQTTGKLVDRQITLMANNSAIGLVYDAAIKIEDSKSHLMSSGYQAGFYFGGNSEFTVRGGVESYGLTGVTGLSNTCGGSTGGPTGATGASGGTGGNSFLIGAPDSTGRATLMFGIGMVGVSLTASVGGLAFKASSRSSAQIVQARNSLTPRSALPDLGFQPPTSYAAP